MNWIPQIQCLANPDLWVSRKADALFVSTAARLSVGLSSGLYMPVTVDGGTVGPDTGALSVSLTEGPYQAIVISEDAPGQAGALSAGITSGEYSPIVVSVDAPANAAALSASLSAGNYSQLTVSTDSPPNAGTLSAGITSGTYAPA